MRNKCARNVQVNVLKNTKKQALSLPLPLSLCVCCTHACCIKKIMNAFAARDQRLQLRQMQLPFRYAVGNVENMWKLYALEEEEG